MALAVVSTFLWQLGTSEVQTAARSAAPQIAALLPNGGANRRAALEPIPQESVPVRPIVAGHDSLVEVPPQRAISAALTEPAFFPPVGQVVSVTTKKRRRLIRCERGSTGWSVCGSLAFSSFPCASQSGGE